MERVSSAVDERAIVVPPRKNHVALASHAGIVRRSTPFASTHSHQKMRLTVKLD